MGTLNTSPQPTPFSLVEVGDYPESLRRITDPPQRLYVRGRIPQQPGIAIVGSRECTRYGRRVAYRLAVDLVRCGFCVVSGLARGVDAAAHNGALDGGGKTIGVMPTGIDRVYPPGHFGLARRIARNGALVTEFEKGTRVYPRNFHQRNRIIAGLAAATIVVEAASRSGAKITARYALEYDREVLAVPGPIDSRVSRGANELIAEGATPCTGVDSVWEQLPPVVRAAATDPGDAQQRCETVAPAELPAASRRILKALANGESHGIDAILASTGLSIGDALAALTDVEVRGLIRSTGDRHYELL